MKKNISTVLLVSLLSLFGYGQILHSKIIDNGGSGPYKSFAVSEKSLPNFVVYRPEDIQKAIDIEGKLPILVWANGGCMDSSIHHERLLTEVASHGYIIVAIGKLQITVDEREHKKTPDKELQVAIDWITKQTNNKKSEYYQIADVNKIAACGMSCGGAQTLGIANDQRIKTYMIFNAGMGDMKMAGASKTSLKFLHANIVYILGGESDIAYTNALLDYERIDHVPVAFASHNTAGHGGTFDQEFGGSFARMALDWLDWQFKEVDNSAIFLEADLKDYVGWTMKAKNF